ncbi:MAG: MFS transporter [Hyphomicrobiaceae bacterium]
MPLLALLALAAFSSAFSIRILDPMVPEVARDLSAQVTTVALLSTAFAFPCALGQPILGALGDAIGKARMIKVCLFVLAIGSIGSTLAPSVEFLFFARMLTGFASGGIVPLCFATVGDRFEMKDRQVALSRIVSAIITGQLVGAIGAGLVASATSWRVVLATTLVASLVALAAAWRWLHPLPGSVRKPFTIQGMLTSYARVLRHPRAVVCYAAVFVEGLVIFGILPYLAAMLEADGTGSIREAGFIIAGMAVGGILYTLSVRALLERMTYLNLIRWGGLVCATGLVGLMLTHAWPPKALAFIAVGFGFYMIHNSIQTQVTELIPEARGASVALHAFNFFLGQAVGPVLYGIGLVSLGPVPTISISALTMVLLGLATAAGFARR